MGKMTHGPYDGMRLCFLRTNYAYTLVEALVKNIGLDATGTNCLDTDGFNVELAKEPINPENHLITESAIARNAFKEFFKKSKLLHSHTE